MKGKRRVRTSEPLTVERELLRFELKKDNLEPARDNVVTEGQMELCINGEHCATFLCSMCQIKELMVGYLLTEGLIANPYEIKNLEVCGEKVNVGLTRKLVTRLSERPQRLLTSRRCKGLKIPAQLWIKKKRASDPSFRLTPQIILRAVTELNRRALVFKRTGGTHASALLDENGGVLAFSEDIGRHNAVDKTVGIAVLGGLDLKRTLLASTGRLTSEMVIRAVHAGIPVMVSISAPTDKGIEIADMAGLTLIAFARGGRFNVYAHPQRIVT